MSTAETIGVTLLATPAAGLVILLVGFAAYQAVAHDLARRLRAHAESLPGGVLDPRTAGLRYAADRIERWGRR